MKLAYGDLIGGLAGDMFVAALLDLGLPASDLERELKKISSLRYRLEVARKTTHGIQATRFRVVPQDGERERSWKEIRRLIERSALRPEAKDSGLKIFARLAEAEAKIHGVDPESVHFHEVGATDSIVDIMAAATGIHLLGIDSFSFSPVPLGRGLGRSRHGPLPVPGPATLELLKAIPVKWTDLEGETVTPTGAAIISALGSSFGDEPEMTIEKIGYGAGQREYPDRPNLFRLVVGERPPAWKKEEMVVLETNIDDMNPEFYDYVLDRLLAAGARDVSLSTIQMKKNRPGTLLRVIAEPWNRQKLAEIIFRETSTIGLRYYPVERLTLKRRQVKARTRFGTVTLKVIEEPGGEKRAAPEYEDVKRLAQAKKVPLRLVYEEALRIFNQGAKPPPKKRGRFSP